MRMPELLRRMTPSGYGLGSLGAMWLLWFSVSVLVEGFMGNWSRVGAGAGTPRGGYEADDSLRDALETGRDFTSGADRTSILLSRKTCGKDVVLNLCLNLTSSGAKGGPSSKVMRWLADSSPL